MALKYADSLNSCPERPCPNTDECIARSVIAYRFLFNTATENDFIPVAFLGRGRDKTCNSFALSFYRSIQEGRAKIQELKDGGHKNIEKKLGDHIGRIQIQPTDGLCSDFSNSGHMNLHPEEAITFHDRVDEYTLITGAP